MSTLHRLGPKIEKIEANDVINIRLDCDQHTLHFGKNDGPMELVFNDLPNVALSPTAKISGMVHTCLVCRPLVVRGLSSFVV